MPTRSNSSTGARPRVVVVHNRYRAGWPSGENIVVDDDIARLRSAGCDVLPFIRDSDDIAELPRTRMLGVAAGLVYAPGAVPQFARLLREQEPDIVHLHNPFPLISPWIVRVAHRSAVPVVQTVHNHRHTCLAGTHYRDGHPCFDCVVAGNSLHGIRHGCYRESRPQSALMATANVIHRGTWRYVSRYLALSQVIRDELIGAGVPESHVVVKPNAVADPGPDIPLGRDVLFAGRLVNEKGIELLLDAWAKSDAGEATLVIAGDGPLRDLVQNAAANSPNIRFAGLLERADLDAEYRRARIVVVPSVWPEPFGLVAIEGLAYGRPTIVTDMGGLPELVDDGAGVVVEPRSDALAAAITSLLRSDVSTMAQQARARYESHYTPKVVTDQLLDVYADAIAGSTNRVRAE